MLRFRAHTPSSLLYPALALLQHLIYTLPGSYLYKSSWSSIAQVERRVCDGVSHTATVFGSKVFDGAYLMSVGRGLLRV